MSMSVITLLKQTFPFCDITYHAPYSIKDIYRNLNLFEHFNSGIIFPSLMPTGKLFPKEKVLGNFKIIIYLLRNILLFVLSKIFKTKAKILLWNKLERDAFDDIVSCDLAIVPPGFVFNDDRGGLIGFAIVFVRIYPLLLAKLFKRQVIFLGGSMGPFNGKLSRWMVRKTFDYVFVREKYSNDHGISAGFDKDRVFIIPDFAWYLLATKSTSITASFDDITLNYFFKDTEYCVGIAIRADERTEISSLYMKSLADLCNYLIDHKKAKIIFFPMSIDILSQDDPIFLKKLSEHIKKKEKVQIFSPDQSIDRYIGLFKRLDLLITSRFHGIILSRPTPVIAVPRKNTNSMSFKLVGMMELLGIPEYVCYLDEPSGLDIAKKLIEKTWINRESVKEQQQKITNQMGNQLILEMQRLKDIVDAK